MIEKNKANKNDWKKKTKPNKTKQKQRKQRKNKQTNKQTNKTNKQKCSSDVRSLCESKLHSDTWTRKKKFKENFLYVENALCLPCDIGVSAGIT